MIPFKSYFQGKRVLVTGDTGFKGSWLAVWLAKLGAKVHGIGLPPDTRPALFDVLQLAGQIDHRTLDIRNPDELAEHVRSLAPDVVVHLAAQAIVRRSYEQPLETLETNFLGTANLLHAVGGAGYTPERPCTVVVVTSDKCYENRETYFAYREDDPVGGRDIYSMSKGAAELLVSAWRRSFHQPDGNTPPAVRVATCRAGNVIGGGDWSPDRIVADCMRMLARGETIQVRNPASIRPWQHVLEPLSGYLQVAAELGETAKLPVDFFTWNFGPGAESERSVGELCDAVVEKWGHGSWTHAAEASAPHEARYLKLSIDKARHRLGWTPVWGFPQCVEQTVAWYRAGEQCSYDSARLRELTKSQIDRYEQDAREAGVKWAVDS